MLACGLECKVQNLIKISFKMMSTWSVWNVPFLTLHKKRFGFLNYFCTNNTWEKGAVAIYLYQLQSYGSSLLPGKEKINCTRYWINANINYNLNTVPCLWAFLPVSQIDFHLPWWLFNNEINKWPHYSSQCHPTTSFVFIVLIESSPAKFAYCAFSLMMIASQNFHMNLYDNIYCLLLPTYRTNITPFHFSETIFDWFMFEISLFSFCSQYICNRIYEQCRVGAEQHEFACSISQCSLLLWDKASSLEQADTTPGGFSCYFIYKDLTVELFAVCVFWPLTASGKLSPFAVTEWVYVCLCLREAPTFLPIFLFSASFDSLIVHFCHQESPKFLLCRLKISLPILQ